MGQYYKPIILEEKRDIPKLFLYSHDFASGLKLMEHSWTLNRFVSHVEKLIDGNPSRVVWAGDYADEESIDKIPKDALKTLKRKHKKYSPDTELEGATLYSIADHTALKVVVAEDVENRYDHDFKFYKYKYLLNLDTKEFVNKDNIPSVDGWKIHPLPLLTCEGNGRGGGDFRGDSSLVGSWSRNLVTVTNKKSEIPKDFVELSFDLQEDI